MAHATSDTKTVKRPGQSGTPVMVRLQPDQLAWLDEWREETGLTRPQAIRYLLEKGRVAGF